MKDRIIEEAVNVLKSVPEGMYCSTLMQRIRVARPELANESFGMHLRNWKREDASVAEPRLATHDETGFFKLAPAALLPADLYSDAELAEVMGVCPATILQWKATGQIPKNCITPDGRYVKSVIDPLIEIFRKTFPGAESEPETREPELPTEDDRLQMAILHEEGVSVTEIALRYKCDAGLVTETLHHFGVTVTDRGGGTSSPKPGRTYSRKKIRFAAEDIQQMVAMHNRGMSLAVIAKGFDCSQSTVSRALSRQGDVTIPDPVEKSEAQAMVEPTNHAEFEKFVRDYWSVGTRAADMLLLPPEVRTRILQAVRETLLYAFGKLNKAEETETDETESLPLFQFARSVNCQPLPEVPNTSARREPPRRMPKRGRPAGTGKYGCKTKAIRVPAHLADDVVEFARTHIGTKNGDDTKNG